MACQIEVESILGGGGGSISNSQLLAMRSVMNDANIC